MPALLSIVVVGRLFVLLLYDIAIGYLLYCLRESHLKCGCCSYTIAISLNNNRLSSEHSCVEVGSPTTCGHQGTALPLNIAS